MTINNTPAIMRDVARRRVMDIVDAHGSIRADALCNELIRRRWAYPGLTPEGIGLDPADILRRHGGKAGRT